MNSDKYFRLIGIRRTGDRKLNDFQKETKLHKRTQLRCVRGGVDRFVRNFSNCSLLTKVPRDVSCVAKLEVECDLF